MLGKVFYLTVIEVQGEMYILCSEMRVHRVGLIGDNYTYIPELL